MTVRREERLTVSSRDDDALSIVQAISEIPAGARLVDVELDAEHHNVMGHRYGTRPVTFTFKREVTDA
ncbi:hypothetical protein D8M34_06020 [Microbacterium sp. HSID17254]|uniref:hypothetical protein n=1 Tax=Microbacterium sp. HSID17254 TaxID=2419509 RepID=UPI000F87D35F|nr:hypothetical protein [Microbacterium sp. HSID17254]RUQ07025.1 hypothetical protein D8M34_06020 [Microbacterium sp. HSID17254]